MSNGCWSNGRIEEANRMGFPAGRPGFPCEISGGAANVRGMQPGEQLDLILDAEASGELRAFMGTWGSGLRRVCHQGMDGCGAGAGESGGKRVGDNGWRTRKNPLPRNI